MRGIEVTLSTIKKVLEYGPETLLLEDIAKFSTIESRKVKINKSEFVQIFKVFEQLISKDLFQNIDDSQIFFINYSNAIAEFDVLTILNYKGKSIVFNIEVKSSEKNVEEKLLKQINNRINDHLQQMFIDDNYLVVGFIDNEFSNSVLKMNDAIKNLSLEELIEMKNSFSKNENVYNRIIISDNLSDIQNVYRKVKEGTFKMYSSNKQTLMEINREIENNRKVVLCLAKPGYGKTVLALNLFFSLTNSKLLILNQKFYYTFNMSEFFYKDRAFYGTETFINSLNANSIAIVDEAQRLNSNTLERIIASSKVTIIFGDTGQAFMADDEFYSNELYEDAIRRISLGNYKKIKLKESIRYPKEVDVDLRYIVDKRTRKDELLKLENFEIVAYNCKEAFFKAYNKLSHSKKIFKMYNYSDLNAPIVVKVDGDTYTYTPAERDFWHFSISENVPKYGHTLHAISFDIENVFLYLDNLHFSKEHNMPVPNNINENEEGEIEKYKNELNILLTRAKKSLHIYVEDLISFLWFNEKIKDITNTSIIFNE